MQPRLAGGALAKGNLALVPELATCADDDETNDNERRGETNEAAPSDETREGNGQRRGRSKPAGKGRRSGGE